MTLVVLFIAIIWLNKISTLPKVSTITTISRLEDKLTLLHAIATLHKLE